MTDLQPCPGLPPPHRPVGSDQAPRRLHRFAPEPLAPSPERACRMAAQPSGACSGQSALPGAPLRDFRPATGAVPPALQEFLLEEAARGALRKEGPPSALFRPNGKDWKRTGVERMTCFFLRPDVPLTLPHQNQQTRSQPQLPEGPFQLLSLHFHAVDPLTHRTTAPRRRLCEARLTGE